MIGACLALIGYIIRSNAQQIVVSFLNGSSLLAYGIGNQDDVIKTGLVAFVGLAGIIAGIILGIIGFMKGDTSNPTVSAATHLGEVPLAGTPHTKYCSNCGRAAVAGTKFCAACGTATDQA